MKRMIVTLSLAALLWPGMSMAQPVAQPTSRSMAREFGLGVASSVLSIVYFPVKLAVGVVGAALGGVGGFVTGGNERVAVSAWQPLTGGSYFVTPQVLEGDRPFLPFDGGVSAPPSAGAMP